MDERITSAVFSAIDEVNKQLPKEQKLEKSMDTVLVGPTSKLDSLGMVNLVVALEEHIEKDFDRTIYLTDESVMSDGNGYFQTIGALCEHITKLLDSAGNG